MNTKNSVVYRRFVAHAGYCSFGEGIAYHSVPSKTGTCRLKICEEIDFDDFWWRRRKAYRGLFVRQKRQQRSGAAILPKPYRIAELKKTLESISRSR